MTQQRFFKVRPDAYERVRVDLELVRGETLCPLSEVARSADGDVLLAAWAFQCDIHEIAACITSVIEGGNGTELSEAEYQSALPPISINGE